MEIIVENVDWGDASIDNINKLLENVASQLSQYFIKLPINRIRVRYDPNGPQTLYRNNQNEDFIVILSVHNLYWDQFAYQFSHEFCHILSEFERFKGLSNKWFQEVICEVASLFTLKQMAREWRCSAPYPNWQDYAAVLEEYANNRIDKHKLRQDKKFNDWFSEKEFILRNDSINRKLNTIIAVNLLPLFQENPGEWESIRYFPDIEENFPIFIKNWIMNVPESHKAFITKIAKNFEISI